MLLFFPNGILVHDHRRLLPTYPQLKINSYSYTLQGLDRVHENERGLYLRFLSPSLRRFCLYQHYLDERKTRRLDATRGKYFSGLSYYKSSVSLYLLSHSRIRIIVLTCPDNINVILQFCKSSAEIMRACKITQITNYDARPLFPSKSSLPFNLFLFM